MNNISTIKSYKILFTIGNGEEGVLFLGKDKNGKKLVLKVYFRDYTNDFAKHMNYIMTLAKKDAPKSLVCWYKLESCKINSFGPYPKPLLYMEYLGTYNLKCIIEDKGFKISYHFIKTLFTDLLNIANWAYNNGMMVFDIKSDSVFVMNEKIPIFKVTDLCFYLSIDPKEYENKLCYYEDGVGIIGIAELILIVLYGPVIAHISLAEREMKKGDKTYLKKLFADDYFPYTKFPNQFVNALEVCIFNKKLSPQKVLNILKN